jgi:N-methylhydantoinase B
MVAEKEAVIDLVTEEVVRLAIRQITTEVSSLLVRISGSPVITEAEDYTVIILGARGELLDTPRSPAYTGSATKAAQSVMAEFGGRLAEGDVLIGNDPHSTGAMHANDFQCVTPIFFDGQCIGFSYLHAHMLDVAGIVPGGWGVGATDCYGEAFRMPFVKYVENGTFNETVQRILGKNSRLPAALLNDIQSMVVAGLAGARQIRDLVTRYGHERYQAITEAFIERTAQAARKRVATLKEGTYEVVDWMEHNGHVNALFEVRAKLTVADAHLHFEFSGVPQTNGLINATDSCLLGYVTSVLSMMLFWDLPVNEGLRRVFSITAARGSVLCAIEPAPVSSAHMDGAEKALTCTSRLVAQAMAASSDPELQQRACAPYAASVSLPVFAGSDDSGNYSVFADMSSISCGGGGSPVADGMDAAGPQAASLMRIPDVESYEAAYPVLYLYRRLARDSGGAGLHRGGTGLEAAWMPWGADHLIGVTNAAGWQVPVPGAQGGYPGGATEQRRVRLDTDEGLPPAIEPSLGDSIEAKAKDVSLGRREVWHMRYPGGGGWGDPLERDPLLVMDDIRLGTVSPAAAFAAYGVVLRDVVPGSHDPGYDVVQTQQRRDALRARRLASAQHHDTQSGQAIRSTRLADALAGNGAWVAPRNDLMLVETFAGDTGRAQAVVYAVQGGKGVALLPADHKVT